MVHAYDEFWPKAHQIRDLLREAGRYLKLMNPKRTPKQINQKKKMRRDIKPNYWLKVIEGKRGLCSEETPQSRVLNGEAPVDPRLHLHQAEHLSSFSIRTKEKEYLEEVLLNFGWKIYKERLHLLNRRIPFTQNELSKDEQNKNQEGLLRIQEVIISSPSGRIAHLAPALLKCQAQNLRH